MTWFTTVIIQNLWTEKIGLVTPTLIKDNLFLYMNLHKECLLLVFNWTLRKKADCFNTWRLTIFFLPFFEHYWKVWENFLNKSVFFYQICSWRKYLNLHFLWSTSVVFNNKILIGWILIKIDHITCLSTIFPCWNFNLCSDKQMFRWFWSCLFQQTDICGDSYIIVTISGNKNTQTTTKAQDVHNRRILLVFIGIPLVMLVGCCLVALAEITIISELSSS